MAQPGLVGGGLALVVLAAALEGCDPGHWDCPPAGCFAPVVGPIAPQDCAALSRATWVIGSPQTELVVGDTRSLDLRPFVEEQCAGSIAAVTWSASDPAVVSLTPKEPGYRGSWITGVHPGSASVSARIRFSDGSVQQPSPGDILVSPAPPPSGALLLRGAIDVAPTGRRVFVPFALPQDAGELFVTIDWTSIQNKVGFAVWRGTCSDSPQCLDLLPMGPTRVEKPLQTSILNVAAGPCTISIHNSGPGAETVRYEIAYSPR